MTLRTALLGSAFAVACAGAFGGAAHAAHINGWYLGFEAGGNWVEDWSHTQFETAVVDIDPATSSFDAGWVVLATVGYGWNHWRFEFEGGYRRNNQDSLSSVDVGPPAAQVTNDGGLEEITFMANVLYDFALMEKLSLSLGAGVGADFAQLDYAPGFSYPEADHWNFAYQAISGLNYGLGSRTSLFLNYRYLRVVSPEFDFRPIVPGYLEGDDFVKHAATIGIRYALQSTPSYFDTEPPPAAAPSGPPRQFIVFFGFNKYNLTTEANRVISEAVVAAKETGSASVLITGHTDTVGSNIYNDRLSMRRSNVVKGEMVRQGISTSSISASGKGETELLVQTADGVKEPQNRRSTIDLN